MVDDSEITELAKVYGELYADGKKKAILMTKHLLEAQLIGKSQNEISENKTEENHH